MPRQRRYGKARVRPAVLPAPAIGPLFQKAEFPAKCDRLPDGAAVAEGTSAVN